MNGHDQQDDDTTNESSGDLCGQQPVRQLLQKKSQSFMENVDRAAFLNSTQSTISTHSMPVHFVGTDSEREKVTNAALFGALKFKGLLNVRLRARRARLGQNIHECGTPSESSGPRHSNASYPRLRGFSLVNTNDEDATGISNTTKLTGGAGGDGGKQNHQEMVDYGTMHHHYHTHHRSRTPSPSFNNNGAGAGGDDDVEYVCEKSFHTDKLAVYDYVFGNKVCIFLICIPFGLLSVIFSWGNSAIFLFNFFAILPLAQLLGDFTEEVALYTNDTIGGLLNATLGNATELIISVFAIRKGLLRVVQVSLLGSVLSNELLVTGCCFLFGGLYHKEQHFNSHITAIDSSLLLMAVLGLTIPAAFSATVMSDCRVPCKVDGIASISHITALLLFFLYGMLLVFQLKTHTHIMDATSYEEHHHAAHQYHQNQQQQRRRSSFRAVNGGIANILPPPLVENEVDISPVATPPPGDDGQYTPLRRTRSRESSRSKGLAHMGSSDPFEDEQDPEEATMTLNGAIFMLTVTTLLVALCSEFLVDSIEAVSESWGLSEVFIGLILLPIIGNAAEHATAITVAMKGKMDLALGVALGSSVQIALCVVPALCVVGWIVDKPLTLDFHPFETIVLVVSVLVVTSTVRQGTSTWLEGIMLIISYCIISIAYYYRKEPPSSLREPSCVCGEPCCFPGGMK